MREENYHKIGWLLFLVCSLFYTVDAVMNGNLIGTIGGLLFFSGCIAFMWPLFFDKKRSSTD